MNQFTHFIGAHPLLFAALVVIIILIILEETRTNFKGIRTLQPQAAIKLINHSHALIIDVRSPTEFQTGHLIGARNFPNPELAKDINKLNKYKNSEIILTCNNGQSSIAGGIILRKHGFAKLYALAGGIVAWKRAGLPLET